MVPGEFTGNVSILSGGSQEGSDGGIFVLVALCIQRHLSYSKKKSKDILTLLCPQKNTGQNGGKPKLDLNVAAAWAQGVTGKNVTTAIMDDGVDYMHPDLINNYVSTSARCGALRTM